MNIIKIRNLILFPLIFLILLFVGYKYFEWKTFSELSNAYNTAYFNEIKLVSENQSAEEDLTNELSTNKQFLKPKDTKDYLEGVSAIETKLNISINNYEGYRDLLNKDLTQFEKLQNGINLLIGERRRIGKIILNNQLAYYKDELKGALSNLATRYGIKILFQIYRDNGSLSTFSDAIGTSVDQTYISKYFDVISPLEKYTNSNYKFENEDYVKEHYPNFINKIGNWKKYFSSYYEAEKDFSVGNIEVAQLKLRTVWDNASNSYIDYSSIFDEQGSAPLNSAKNILKLVSEQAASIKDYKQKGLYKYPLLKEISIWKEDLVLCQMYNYKSSIFNAITSKYPSSKTVSDLIKELSTISPKTDNVDSRFDKSTMEFKNTDKQLEFVCKDKYSGEKIKFFITKPID
jgi:hypothetical protein